MSSIIPFTPANVPAHAYNPNLLGATNDLVGGLQGGRFNRIGTKGKVWRIIEGGQEVAMLPQQFIDVVILGATPHVSRQFFGSRYQEGVKAKPLCQSEDGVIPIASSAQPQASACASCPQNQIGSAIGDDNKKRRACQFLKRLVVAPADAVTGNAYAIDVKSMSLFGDGYPQQNMYSLGAFGKMLAQMKVSVAAVRVRLYFDPNQTGPSLLFQPVGFLPAEQIDQVIARSQQEDVQYMLTVSSGDDGDAPETPAPAAGGTVAAAPAPQYTPQPVAPTPPVTPAPPQFQQPQAPQFQQPQAAPQFQQPQAAPQFQQPQAPQGFTAPQFQQPQVAPQQPQAPQGFAVPQGAAPAAPEAPKSRKRNPSKPAETAAPQQPAAPAGFAAPQQPAAPAGFAAPQAPAGFAAPQQSAAPQFQQPAAPAPTAQATGAAPGNWANLMKFDE